MQQETEWIRSLWTRYAREKMHRIAYKKELVYTIRVRGMNSERTPRNSEQKDLMNTIHAGT